MTRLTQPLFGFDYTSAIAPSVLRAYGCRFVVRYLSRYSWKALTRTERQALEGSGIGIALVFEDGAKNAWGGYAQGKSDAEYAFNQARALFGSDTGGKITFAVDNPTNGQPQVTDQYFDGVGAVLGRERSGPYGDVYVVSHQANRGFGALFQTYAWSGRRLDDRAQIYQFSNDHHIGPGVDYDHVYYSDYGQWNERPAPPHPIDKYAIFFTKSTFHGMPNNGNERITVEMADGALAHPQKYRSYLKGKVYYELKAFRDACWRAAWYLPPDYKKHKRSKPDWTEHNRGTRWQLINNRMKKITAL